MHERQLLYNLTYTILWNEMAYTMHTGLTPTWVDLSHTHISSHEMKKETLDMRAHVHANRGPNLRHKCHSNKAWQGMQHDMQTCKFQYQNMLQNSPETWQYGTRCMKWDPKRKTRHTQWPIAIQSMHYLNMKCEDRIKTVPKQVYFQFQARPKGEHK